MENEKQKFIQFLKNSIDNNSFVKIVIGKYRGGDKEFQNIFISRIKTTEGEKFSFKFRYKTKDVVKNYDFGKGIKLVDEIVGKDFFSATLFSTKNDYNLDYSKKRIPKLHKKKPSFISSETKEHNKSKSRFVDANAKYLHLLGITNSEGKIKTDKYDKFRQIDKFIEIMDSLYRASKLKNKDEMKIFDMGSGKSYLAFAMYDYFSNTLGKNVKVKGIEQRDELVKLSNKVTKECGFKELSFESGSIESFNDKADIVVALHACDTATDDAIFKSIQSEAEIIVLAPCCHKYVRKKMQSPEELKSIYKHGILFEGLAVSLTDGLRALILEHFGYETKVFEFISLEHTAKNIMITAVRKESSDGILKGKLLEIEAVKNKFSIEDFYLDKKIL